MSRQGELILSDEVDLGANVKILHLWPISGNEHVLHVYIYFSNCTCFLASFVKFL